MRDSANINVMADVSFYENFSVATVEKPEGEKREFKLKRGLFVAGEFQGSIPDVINILPKPGNYKHAIYGQVIVTRERNQEFADNFNNEVYQRLIPIDLEHETFLSGACAYYEPGSALVQMDGSVNIGVRWEARGAQALNEGRFYYFSPMWFDRWQEPLSKKIYNNVLIGGALTTTPYFKDANLRPLYASELIANSSKTEGQMDEKEASGKCPDCGATMGEGDTPHTCSKKANEPEGKKEPMTEETKTPVVDPVQFAEMQKSFAAMQQTMAAQAETIAKQEADLKIANERAVKTAAEARVRRFKEIITGTSPDADGAKAFRGAPEVHGAVLDIIYQVEGEKCFTEEESIFNKYIAEMRGLAEQYADIESLKSRGGTGGKEPSKGSATSRWNAAVAKAMTDDPKLTQIEAYTKVAAAQPELYRQQNRENYATKGDEE